MILLFLSLFGNAECPQMYAKQVLNGSWVFSKNQDVGMLPVESDESCQPEANTHHLVGGRYVLDQALLDKKRADEKKETDEAKPVSRKEFDLLKKRVEELEK